jgi:hypothetical protein
LKLDRKRRVAIRLACGGEVPAGCQGTVALRTRHKLAAGKRGRRRFLTLARARFSIRAGRTGTVRLKLTAAKARLVRVHAAARRVLAIAAVGDPAGDRTTARRTLTLRPR